MSDCCTAFVPSGNASGGGGGTPSTVGLTLVNDEAAPIVIGAPVYIDAPGGVKLARANAAATTNAIGLVGVTTIAPAAAGAIDVGGVIEATTAQWDVITGAVGGLTAGSRYYLSAATAGKLTTVAPSVVGQFVVDMGIALSATKFKIDIQEPILL
jgi:hypothetical protein